MSSWRAGPPPHSRGGPVAEFDPSGEVQTESVPPELAAPTTVVENLAASLDKVRLSECSPKFETLLNEFKTSSS